MRLDPLQGCQCSRHQWRSHRRGVSECPAGLQQLLPHGVISGQKGTTAAKGFAEGATDQMHWMPESMTQSASAVPQHAQGMGFIDEKPRTVCSTEACE